MIAKVGGIGFAVVALALLAILVGAGLDRRWPRTRYASICANEEGLTFVRQGPTGERGLLKWENIERVEVERRLFVSEVRVVGAGSDRGKSLKLSSLAWTRLDRLVTEILARSPARLVEGRRGRTGEEYF